MAVVHTAMISMTSMKKKKTAEVEEGVAMRPLPSAAPLLGQLSGTVPLQEARVPLAEVVRPPLDRVPAGPQAEPTGEVLAELRVELPAELRRVPGLLRPSIPTRFSSARLRTPSVSSPSTLAVLHP